MLPHQPLKPPHQDKLLPLHQPLHQLPKLQLPKLQPHQPPQPHQPRHQLPHNNKNKQQMLTMKPKTKKMTKKKPTMMLKM